ncbi:MAG: hypothetical protein JWQ90_2359 [Hydrocarboniphaga sp.]|uniref:phosphotransferase n=1 Tax=Hydrocarboniphaga sp. TaxID=2033016 RepID=UPI0026398AEE|nr:phosphotransferase [Hydrocarboniphaga sp.]MDB5969909.1 hypothetical protein [Hydrocarboniphaga sp.]
MSIVSALSETVLSLSPWLPRTGPVASAQLTPRWLTQQIAADVPGAEVERIERLDGNSGTTDRRRLALHWNERGKSAGLPASVFIKSTPLTASSRLMVAPLQMAVNEVRFYRTVRQDLADVAPLAYATHLGRGARFMLVLEDLSLRGCRPFSLADEADLDHLRGMMVALGTVHARFWNSPRFSSDLSWLATERARPAFSLMMMVHRRFRKRFLKPETQASDPVRRLARVLIDNEQAVIDQRERGPLTLAHGDCHLGNTYRLADEERSGLLDWQIVHRGAGLRELAYFLGPGAPIELRRRHEKDLLALYLDTLASLGVRDAPKPEQAWDLYRFWMSYAWDAVQMTQMWAGLQAPANLTASWARVCAAVEDLDVAGAVKDAI